MTDLPKTIWLLPGLGDEGGAVWCDDPAPGADMDPDDATEYLRADIARARVAEAREQEREACAVVAERRWRDWKEAEADECDVECDVTACADIAAAIRARGAAPEAQEGET